MGNFSIINSQFRSNSYFLVTSSQLKKASPIEAMNLSIEKWQTIADFHHTYPDAHLSGFHGGTCALCAKYYGRDDPEKTIFATEEAACPLCPIVQYDSKCHGCENTPWRNYSEEQSEENALIMVEFLQIVKETIYPGE